MRYQLPREKLALKLIKIWSDSSAPEHKIIGSSYLLSTETIIYMIFDNWRLFKKFIKSIFLAHNHSSHKLQSIINGTMVLYEHCLYPLPIVILSNKDSEKSINQTKENQLKYREIIEYISLNSYSLSWSFQERLLHYLSHLINFGKDEIPSLNLCNYLIKCMKSDVVVIRASAVDVLTQLLLNLIIKRPRKKIQNDIKIDNIHLFQMEFQGSSQNIPSTSDEWESTAFIDSNFYGWNGKTKKRKIYIPLSDIEHKDREILYAANINYEDYKILCKKYNVNDNFEIFQCRNFLFSTFINEDFWRSVLISWAHEARDSDYSDYSSFFQLCFVHFPDMMNTMKPLVVDLCKEEQHIEPQSLAAEITSGMIRGSKHWSFSRILQMREFIIPFFDKSLALPHFKCWRDVTYVSISALDYRRIHWIFEFFEKKLTVALQQQKSTQSIQITHIFEYFLAIFSCLSWRAAGLGADLFKMILSHKYIYEAPLLVRVSMGEVLQVIITLMYSGIRDTKTNIPIIAPVTTTCNFHDNYPQVGMLIHKISNDILLYKFRKNVNTSSSLSSNNDNHVNTTNQQQPLHSVDEELQRQQNRFIHCILIMLLPNIENYLRRLIPIIFPLFPVALLLIDDHDVDIANTSWKIVGAFACSEFDPFWMERLFDIAISILMNTFDLSMFSNQNSENENGSTNSSSSSKEFLQSSWRVRCSTLTFLQTFVCQNMFFLTKEKIEKLLHCLYVSMGHSQVEVRTTAGSALSSVLRFMDEDQQVELWDKFDAEAQKPIENISSKSLHGKEQLISRHRAIIGMAAIVNVHPYSIPKWLPNRLVEFATHIHDPVPVKVSFYFYLLL